MTLTITPRPKPCCNVISVNVAFDEYYVVWYLESDTRSEKEPDSDEVQITCDVCKGVWIADRGSWTKTFPVETTVPKETDEKIEPLYEFLKPNTYLQAGDQYLSTLSDEWVDVSDLLLDYTIQVPNDVHAVNKYRRQVK